MLVKGFYLADNGTDYEFHEEVPRSYYYEKLVDIAVLIILAMVVMLGHNSLGYGLGALCAMMVLIIPCFMFAMVEGAVSTMAIVSAILLKGGSMGDIIYDYSIVGLLLVIVLILPLATLLSIVVYPTFTALLTIEMLCACIFEALEIVDDITP